MSHPDEAAAAAAMVRLERGKRRRGSVRRAELFKDHAGSAFL
jgi:hypothetical protein